MHKKRKNVGNGSHSAVPARSAQHRIFYLANAVLILK